MGGGPGQEQIRGRLTREGRRNLYTCENGREGGGDREGGGEATAVDRSNDEVDLQAVEGSK